MSESAPRHLTTADALSLVEQDERYAVAFERGSIEVGIYRLEDQDRQQPHTRDELYIVARGEGFFVNGEAGHRFGTGDFLFVPAGVVHRFEDFTDDLTVWVVFYGPEGGEQP